MARRTLYITTPIYYVNDKPHIGHVYSTTVCDVWARFQRFAGHDVFFLTGTDEHAAKVVDAAKERGITAQQWADQNAAAFRAAFESVGISNDDFIRTSEDRHKSKVLKYVSALLKTGDVYLGEYSGWYDAGQEEYVPAGKAREYHYKSPINGKPLVEKKEKNYFFKLSAYRDALAAHFKANPHFVQPDARRNEILNRIAEADDVPISRSGMTGWGIGVPGDDSQSIYVWIDALFNYLTTVDTSERQKYWHCGALHVLAKDILWFHAAIWPALLMALAKCEGYSWVNLPRQIYCHSFWISEGQKMSKSLGNFIDLPLLHDYADRYSLDAVRYYLAANGPLGSTDSDFSASHFHEIYTTELVNTLGNCASRVTAMIGKYFDNSVPGELINNHRATIAQHDWPALASRAVQNTLAAMERMELAGAIGSSMSLVRQVDGFINATEPFNLAKDASKRDELGAILYQCAEAIRIASLLLWAVCPTKVEQLWDALGQHIDPGDGVMLDLAKWGGLKQGTIIAKVALFPRVEPLQQPVEA